MTRTLLFATLFQASGAVFFGVFYGRLLSQTVTPLINIARTAAVAGVVLVVLHQVLDAARMADDLAGIVDAGLERLAWQGASGLAALLQIAGLSLIIFGSRRSRRARAVSGFPVTAIVGAPMSVVADVLIGHASVHDSRAVLMPLLALHLLLVAFWFGALLPLIRCCRSESRETVMAVMRGFSRQAGFLVPLLGLAGVCIALILLPHRADWRSDYAWFILAKIAAFAALLLLAAWNRWRGVPAVATSSGTPALSALQRSIAIEYALILAVMAVTATMTASYSPP